MYSWIYLDIILNLSILCVQTNLSLEVLKSIHGSILYLKDSGIYHQCHITLVEYPELITP